MFFFNLHFVKVNERSICFVKYNFVLAFYMCPINLLYNAKSVIFSIKRNVNILIQQSALISIKFIERKSISRPINF